MLDYFFRLVSEEMGIDLGTSNTRIWVGEKGVMVREPSFVAKNKKTKEVVAIGAEAKKMVGRTPGQLLVVSPLHDGVIYDYDACVFMLAFWIKALHQAPGFRVRIPRPRVVMSIPPGVTAVEKKAVADVARGAGARRVHLLEGPIAAALGASLPIFAATGVLLVDIGGGTTELAVVSLGGIVVNRSLRVAGTELDEAIINFMRLKYSLLVGLPTAEELKIQIGSVLAERGKGDKQAIIRGRDLSTGLPRSIRVSAAEVREAMAPLINQVISAVTEIIEETPPELLGDITQRGIMLTGGTAQLPGLAQLVTEVTKMPAQVVDDPLNAVVRGCGRLLADEGLLKRVALSQA